MSTPLPPAELFSLGGRVAIVTGASSGLGDRFARVLHGAGAHVVAAARREARLSALAADLPGLLAVRTDVTDGDDLGALVEQTMKAFGRIDVLVNNAGGGSALPALDESVQSFVDTVQLNLVSVFELSRHVAKVMIEQGSGSIINIASVLGLVSNWPLPNGSYAAAKGAVVQLTRELGCQWAPKGVRVNALAPGYFPSEGMAPAVADERFQAFVRRNCPTGRMGQEHELDGALLFLAGDASTYVTGQVLTVDGGWTAR